MYSQASENALREALDCSASLSTKVLPRWQRKALAAAAADNIAPASPSVGAGSRSVLGTPTVRGGSGMAAHRCSA